LRHFFQTGAGLLLGTPRGYKDTIRRVVEYNRIRQVSGLKTTSGMTLSGGQMQRLALYAIFTAHMVSD